jgi:YggT family protein
VEPLLPRQALGQRNRLAITELAMMGVMSGGSLVLADAVSSIQSFISVFTGVYVLIIFAYILTSWVRLPYSPTLNRIQRFLYDVCEPYLRVFRRILPPFGPLDLSPIVAVFALIIGARIVNSILERLQ